MRCVRHYKFATVVWPVNIPIRDCQKKVVAPGSQTLLQIVCHQAIFAIQFDDMSSGSTYLVEHRVLSPTLWRINFWDNLPRAFTEFTQIVSQPRNDSSIPDEINSSVNIFKQRWVVTPGQQFCPIFIRPFCLAGFAFQNTQRLINGGINQIIISL